MPNGFKKRNNGDIFPPLEHKKGSSFAGKQQGTEETKGRGRGVNPKLVRAGLVRSHGSEFG